MNEEKEKSFSELSDDVINFLNNPDATGLEILSMILALPDEEFNIIRPVLQEAVAEIYNDPQIKYELYTTFTQLGISADEILDSTDEIAKAILKTDGVVLSDGKKDFLHFIFSEILNAVSESTLNPARYIEIPVELCRDDAKLPSYATDGAGAMDIYSPIDIELNPGECKIVPIGIKVVIPHGYGLLIQPRSGLSSRIKLRIPNTPGLIDEDYHEEIGVIVENIDPKIKEIGLELKENGELVDGTLFGSNISISKGERFAQMRLVEIPRVKWRQVASIGNYDNDHGAGFGSTGVK